MTATTIDTPEGISNWYFLSAVSQLHLELKTGMNYYGKTSVLKALQLRGYTSVTGRATVRNKVLALAELLEGQPSGPVIDLARATLAAKLDELGLQVTFIA